jgi:hypothetical protein
VPPFILQIIHGTKYLQSEQKSATVTREQIMAESSAENQLKELILIPSL